MGATDPLGIEINDRRGMSLPPQFIERVVCAARDRAGRSDLAVSLLVTGDEEIAGLHDRFTGDPSSTDVLSFPMDDGVDLAVNAERAARVAAESGHAVEAELALYIIHGILHVCGYDDIAPEHRGRMRAVEREVLATLGLRVAPVDD